METPQHESASLEPKPEASDELLNRLRLAGDEGLSLSDITELAAGNADFPTVFFRLRTSGIINMTGNPDKPGTIRYRYQAKAA